MGACFFVPQEEGSRGSKNNELAWLNFLLVLYGVLCSFLDLHFCIGNWSKFLLQLVLIDSLDNLKVKSQEAGTKLLCK